MADVAVAPDDNEIAEAVAGVERVKLEQDGDEREIVNAPVDEVLNSPESEATLPEITEEESRGLIFLLQQYGIILLQSQRSDINGSILRTRIIWLDLEPYHFTSASGSVSFLPGSILKYRYVWIRILINGTA